MSQASLIAPEPVSPSDARRKHILAAARACFAKAGFHGASMQQICAEAKMSPGALYRYFPSKEAIIEAIAEEERTNAGACIAALFGEGSVADRFTAVAMDYLGASRDPESGGLMVEICSESLRNTAVGERFCEIENEVRSAFRKALETAQTEGEIAADLDIAAVLTILFSLGDGLLMRLQIERDVELATIEPHLRRVIAGLLGQSVRC